MIDPRRILYRDDHLLAVNKLGGELTVAGAGRAGKLSLLDFLRKDFPGLKPLHRLDFETSGVVLFARTKQAMQAVRQSKFRGWEKTYVALIAGHLPRKSGEIRSPLPARARPNVPFRNGRGEGNVPALTKYRVLEVFANSSLVEAQIQTGRHHQIRRHFAALGHPLILDEEYGQRAYNRVFSHEFRLHRFFLHAAQLSLPHPVIGKQIVIEAPMSKVFESVLERLRRL